MLQFNPSHPGEILKADYLEPLELSITEAADGLDIARKNLSAIVNGKAGISPEMAIRLSEAFDTTPDLWLNLQTNYDLWKVKNSRERRNIRSFYKITQVSKRPGKVAKIK
jgi:addiction module HigA family antidote